MILLKVAAVLHLAVFVACNLNLPSHFPKCYKNDPNLNSCLLKATEEVRQSLETGIPSLHIPSIAPLLPYQIYFESNNSILDFKVTMTDVVISGFENYKVSKISCDFKKLVLDYHVPALTLEGSYEMTGKVLNVQMFGKGFLQVNYTNLHSVTTIDLQEILENGVAYLNITKIDSKMDIDNFDFIAKGLAAKGMSVIEANNFILSNKKVLLEAFTPTFENLLEEILETMIFKHIFKVPLDKLFPTK